MSYHDTWLIVPMHNEASAVGSVLDAVLPTFPNVVCVDDGSRDQCGKVAADHGAHLVRHSINLGQGAALQTGIEFARNQAKANRFITFDADGQHQVSDVERMLATLHENHADIALGTRFHGGQGDVPLLKQIILKTSVKLSPRLRSLNLSDAHNGLRAFTRRVAENINLVRNGMGHASEFVQLIAENGWNVTEVPVTIRYTDYSQAKGQSLINGVNILFEGALRACTDRRT